MIESDFSCYNITAVKQNKQYLHFSYRRVNALFQVSNENAKVLLFNAAPARSRLKG